MKVTRVSAAHICLRVGCSLLCTLAVSGVSYSANEKVKVRLIKYPGIPPGVSYTSTSG